MSELNPLVSPTALPRLRALAQQAEAEQKESQLVAGSFLLGLGLGFLLKRRRHKREFAGQNVLLTGGTRGLGLNLVREFSDRGARVIFCSRTADEITRAEDFLAQEGYPDVIGMLADVSRPDGPAELVARVIREVGQIDILVNNAGQIQVAPFVDSEEQAFHQCLDLFLYAPLRMAKEVLPSMMAAGHGTIVNITSVGGQVPAPHLVPYNCGKAAMVALSEGMSVELDRYGVHVMTVVPGLMRTGAHRNAMFGGNQDEEYAWFSRAAIHPALAKSAVSAAREIVDGVLAKRRTVSLGWEAKWAPLLHKMFPETSHAMTSLVEKMMPGAGLDAPLQMGEIVAPDSPPLSAMMQRLERNAMEQHQAARFTVATSPTGSQIEA